MPGPMFPVPGTTPLAAGPAGPSAPASPYMELMQLFVNMGMNPQTAAELAQKIGVMEPPSPPLANGVKLEPGKSNFDTDPEFIRQVMSAPSPGRDGFVDTAKGFARDVADAADRSYHDVVDPSPGHNAWAQAKDLAGGTDQPPSSTIHMSTGVDAPGPTVRMSQHVNAPVRMHSTPGYTVTPVPIADLVDEAIKRQEDEAKQKAQADIDRYEGGPATKWNDDRGIWYKDK